MRTVDATLTAALAAGTGTPRLIAHVGYSTGQEIASHPATAYKLTGTRLEIELPYVLDYSGDQDAFWLERGVTIAGVNYTLTTSRFYIHSRQYSPDGHQILKGALFPRQYYTASADTSYSEVITALCAAYGKTAVFKDPGAAWLAYQFYPAGKDLISNDANSIFNLLAQKYLVFGCDNGSEGVLFYACDGAFPAADLTLTPTASYWKEQASTRSRYLMWRDELETIHNAGTATDPIHNLGYLQSTASAPVRHSAPFAAQAVTRPDLRILDGDCIGIVAFGATDKLYALVTEEYAPPDRSHKQPRWDITIDANTVFGNTSGGAMPSTIERVSNYTPLNTSMFDSILSPTENNVQAAFDRLDDHKHLTPLLTNLLNAQVPAATSWSWCPGTVAFNASGYQTLMPLGKLKNLRVRVNSAQPGTGSMVVTVYINGLASAITLTIPAGGGGVGVDTSDTTHVADILAGQPLRITFQNNAPGTPSAQIGALSLEFYPTP